MSRVEFSRAHVPALDEVLSIADSSLAVIDRWRTDLPVADALAVIEHVRAHCDAAEAELLAARLEAGATQRSVESLLQHDARTSKRSAKQRTKRAKAVNVNPALATKLKKGELSTDQADVLADAADKTDGAAATDDELVDKVAATPPDQAKRLVDDWVRAHTEAEDVQDRYDRQRRRRCVKRWKTDRDTHVVALEGDEPTIDRIEHAIRNRSSELYRADGGRDVPGGRHPRTRDQRNFDAAVELLTGPDTMTTAGGAASADATSTKTTPSSVRPPARATIVVTMTHDQATGADPTPVGQVGGALLAPSLLQELFCGAELVGIVTDQSGMPLWLGRTSRRFSRAQWLALISRDRGCVHCGAHYSRCEAHHIIPWEAPARGPTDIDNAALVCSDCHHWLHDHDLVLVRDPEAGTWTTRPGRPEEVAPKRRPQADPARPHRPQHRPPRLHERPRADALL